MKNILDHLETNLNACAWQPLTFLINCIQTTEMNIGRAMKMARQMKATS